MDERRLVPRVVVIHEPQSGAIKFIASGSSQSTTYKASLRFPMHAAQSGRLRAVWEHSRHTCTYIAMHGTQSQHSM